MSKYLKMTDKKIISLLYQLMYDVHRLFTEHGIEYWVIGGTFLGAVRNKGIIQSDDDVDIGMQSHNISKFLELEPQLNKCGYKISKVWLGYKIFYDNRPLSGRHNYSFPNLDIFTMVEHGTKMVCSIEAVRKKWPKEYYYPEELYPLKKYQFGNFEVYGPNRYEDYFVRTYGNNWDKVTYSEYDHEKEEVIERVEVKLTPKLRQPAKPTKIINRTCIHDNKKPLEIKNKVIVSLTTIPSRISVLYKTIKNILKQTQYINKIYLNIPSISSRGDEYEIPEKLSDFIYENNKKGETKIILNRRCKDIGPGTKLYPTLQREKNPNTFIITIDDDMIYDKRMIELLVKEYMISPNRALGYHGWNVGPKGQMKDLGSILAGGNIDVLEGFAGVLYVRHLFMRKGRDHWIDESKKLLTMMKAGKECFYTDDVWISAWFAKQDIDRYLVDTPNDYMDPKSHSESKDALSDNPEVEKRNAKCARKFKKFW